MAEIPSNIKPFGKIELYNRLEPRPRLTDFQQSLRTEVADALWMLARQWQFGEFKGEDTGSAVHMKVSWTETPITQLRTQQGDIEPHYTPGVALEPFVESQPVAIDLKTSLRLTAFWKELLLSDPSIDGLNYFSETCGLYPIPPVPQFNNIDDAVFLANPELIEIWAAVENHILDGVAWVHAIANANNSAAALIAPAGTPVAELAKIDSLGQQLLEIAASLGVQTSHNFWQNKRLEYSFDAVADHGGSPKIVLSADEYNAEQLDWYAFDFNNDPQHPARAGKSTINRPAPVHSTSVIPTKIQFPGMPAARFWEFEDGQVNLGKLNAQTSDIAQILLAEFSLMYSNDWMMIPLSLPCGTVCDIREIVVTDSFGIKTLIPAAAANISDNTWQKWGMFNLNTKDNISPDQVTDTRLVVPHVPTGKLNSQALEQVFFVRDETANLVWAIEEFVPDGFGGSMDGHTAAQNRLKYLTQIAPNRVFTEDDIRMDTNSTFKYTLADLGQLPENRIPFKAESLQGQLMLRRGKRRRVINGVELGAILATCRIIRPEGQMQETPFYIYANEIPKEGITVQSTWQRCRTANGSILVWLGNELKNGTPNLSTNPILFDNLERL